MHSDSDDKLMVPGFEVQSAEKICIETATRQ